jgi:hypothetical protein
MARPTDSGLRLAPTTATDSAAKMCRRLAASAWLSRSATASRYGPQLGSATSPGRSKASSMRPSAHLRRACSSASVNTFSIAEFSVITSAVNV